MEYRNNRRECRNNCAEELGSMNRRNCNRGEANDCCRREHDCFAEALEDAYNQGFCDGTEEGYDKGHCEGYQEGLKDGYEKAKQEVLDYVNRNKCCLKCCKSDC